MSYARCLTCANMTAKKKKRKVKSRNSAYTSMVGGGYCSSALEIARSKWESGDTEPALDMIMEIVSKFPRSESAYRLMLHILVEEEYHPQDIIWCIERIKKIGRLSQREKKAEDRYGGRKMDLSLLTNLKVSFTVRIPPRARGRLPKVGVVAEH